MPLNSKRLVFGVLALLCFLWLRSSWAHYRLLADNWSSVAAAAVFTLLFALLTFDPEPGRHQGKDK
jgi:hypothetical protein